MRPRLAGVGRLVDAVAVAHRIAQRRLAAADVDRVRRRRRHRERADRRDRLRIEHRRPDAPAVDRLPDAAVHRSEVELVRAAGNAAHRIDAPAAEWPEHPPVQSGIQIGALLSVFRGHFGKKAVGERAPPPRHAADKRVDWEPPPPSRRQVDRRGGESLCARRRRDRAGPSVSSPRNTPGREGNQVSQIRIRRGGRASMCTVPRRIDGGARLNRCDLGDRIGHSPSSSGITRSEVDQLDQSN